MNPGPSSPSPPQPAPFKSNSLLSKDPQNPPAPLAPSVEKAYYRKCIALKRRLNEVESANDSAKIRRLRLDRAIMKMRLERAFLLDELRKRMDLNVDGSEGSEMGAPEGPPQDRPKRRRGQGEEGWRMQYGVAPVPNGGRTGSNGQAAQMNGEEPGRREVEREQGGAFTAVNQ